MFDQKMYILLVNDEVDSSVTSHISTINKQTDLNKSFSKLKLFK